MVRFKIVCPSHEKKNKHSRIRVTHTSSSYTLQQRNGLASFTHNNDDYKYKYIGR